MGLDVSLYNNKEEFVGDYEIKEGLHNEIFNSKKLWRSYLELRKLSDYYVDFVEYKGQSLIDLIDDLNRYKMFIPQHKQELYQELIDKIDNPAICKIDVAGD